MLERGAARWVLSAGHRAGGRRSGGAPRLLNWRSGPAFTMDDMRVCTGFVGVAKSAIPRNHCADGSAEGVLAVEDVEEEEEEDSFEAFERMRAGGK